MSVETNGDLNDEEGECQGNHSPETRFARYLEMVMTHVTASDLGCRR